jgi:hypothetical protein
MKTSHNKTAVLGLLLAALFAGSVFSLQEARAERRHDATLEEVLYLPSGKILKRCSLGYSSLLADIYWTRAVQYFGFRHANEATEYNLLYPLLDITTDLDPKMIVAYEYGSVYLSQPPPHGAGEPDKAAALVEKGIKANPEYWRLYFTLGFIHYIDRRDYPSAQAAFAKGAEIPGALPFMKVMAARMADRRKDPNTAMALWQQVYDSAANADLKNTAVSHLESIRADLDIMELDRRIKIYYDRSGSYPANWGDLVRTGLLRSAPVDPKGAEYKLMANGVVNVEDPRQFPFLNEWRYQ